MKNATQTATTISALLDDGELFTVAGEGDTLDELSRLHGASIHKHGTSTRYNYPDGSSIVDAGDAWDLAFPGVDCHCWKSMGHHGACEL